jgi:hypothetical protein
VGSSSAVASLPCLFHPKRAAPIGRIACTREAKAQVVVAVRERAVHSHPLRRLGAARDTAPAESRVWQRCALRSLAQSARARVTPQSAVTRSGTGLPMRKVPPGRQMISGPSLSPSRKRSRKGIGCDGTTSSSVSPTSSTTVSDVPATRRSARRAYAPPRRLNTRAPSVAK